MRRRSILPNAIGALLLGVLTSCAAPPKAMTAPAQSPLNQAMGYLSAADRPNGVSLLPPPPEAGSSAAMLDESESRRYLAVQGSERWQLASADAVLTFPLAPQTFACALDLPITEQDTPRLYTLLRRVLIDAGRSTSTAKERYQRTRPFVVNQRPSCTPEREDVLRKDGSYPSGHSAIGWAWALVLTEVAPERADALLARGRAFGESRLVCNVHWRSDVMEGHTMAAATVARLHANAAFRTDVAAAAIEVQAARSKGLSLPRDCAAEAKVLIGQ